MNAELRDAIARNAHNGPDRAFWIGADERLSWSDLQRRVSTPAPGGPGALGLRLEPRADALVAFLARAVRDLPVVLLPTSGDPRDHLALGLDEVWVDGEVVAGPGGLDLQPGDVVIVTSGTTGAPKIVRHDVTSLFGAVRGAQRLDHTVWLRTYPLGLYAGLQVLAHVILGGATLVEPPADGDVAALSDRLYDAGVTHVSATPSWWRRLLLFGDRRRLSLIELTQLTLGGEVADDAVLDGLARLWPRARITHIYATSELGRCFSVHDRRAGFPRAWLSTPTPDGVELRVEDGELCARSPNRMRGYAGAAFDPHAWVRTGDLVEIEGDRVRFVGRLTDRINVGGNKVDPIKVEAVLRGCAALRDVKVYGKRSSIAGEIVAADVVPAAGTAPDVAKAAAQDWARERLSDAERPRSWRVVDEIAVAPSGKRVRTS
jgi:acyl-CoA synthetase (AMP-forming)/AMP-acid ligase II